MKTLIIDSSQPNEPISAEINQSLLNLLDREQSSVTRITLAHHDIKGCIGCLNCFFKTPGECHFNDIARELPKHYIASDLAVFIAPVTFGGYSSVFAKAYNRMMVQLESHLVETLNGELLRKKRYDQEYPSVMVIGLEKESDSDAEKIFTALVNSNALLHLRAPKHSLAYISTDTSATNVDRKIRGSFTSLRRHQ
jgi:multimeric flavodoxin WrbA